MEERLLLSVLSFVLVSILVLVGVVVSIRRQKSFNERFPPISDAEFLARCSPRTNAAVALRVRRIIAEFLPVEYERIHPSMSFIEDIGAD